MQKKAQKMIIAVILFLLISGNAVGQQWLGPANKDSAILRRGGITIGLDTFRYKGPNMIHMAKQVLIRTSQNGDLFDVVNEQDSIVDGADIIWGVALKYQPGDVGLLSLSSPLSSSTGPITRFTVRSNGNVGIGVRNPTNKLDVDGTIHAKEIIIQTDNWPDYVFDNSYSLMSLDSLDNFINKNKHLPEIPSSKEINNEGLKAGQMTGKMLKKIEELTLYIINQNKKISEQNEQLIKQQKEIDKLKERVSDF